MATATQKIIIHADDQTGAAIASAIRNSQKLDNQLKKNTDSMRGFTRQGRAQMGQLGHQMQDVAVQLQMGMNPMMILGQQGSQIAAIFGSGGAVVGAFIAVAAVIGSVFVPSLFDAKREAGEFHDDIIKAAGGVDKLTEAQRRLAELDLKLRIQEQQRAVEQAQQSIEDFRNKIENLEKAQSGSGRSANGASLAIKRLGGGTTELEQALALAEAQLAATKEQMKELTGESRDAKEAQKKLIEAFKEYEAMEKARQRLLEISQRKAQAESQERIRALEAAKPATQRFAEESERLRRVIAGLDGEMSPLEIEAYRVAIEKAAKSILGTGEAAKVAQKRTKNLSSAQRQHFDMIQTVGDNALQSMEDSLIGLAEGSLSAKDAFKQMAASILRDLLRMQMQAGRNRLSGFLANTFIGLSTGGDASRVTTGQGGMGPVQSGPPSLRAMGGPVSRNTPYIVGERGPELMIPSGSGRVVPSNELATGDSISVNLNITTGVSQTVRAEIANLMPQIQQATKAGVLEARQRGGSYSRALAGI